MKSLKLFAITVITFVAVAVSSSTCRAQLVPLTGGEITLDLNEIALGGLAVVTSVTPDVTVIGSIDSGFDQLVFDINSRDAPSNPTTFEYSIPDLDPDLITPVDGTVGTSGSIFFNDGLLGPDFSIGDLEFGFDATRINPNNSGFFAESTTGFEGIVFDIGEGDSLLATKTDLEFFSDIFLSPELAAELQRLGIPETLAVPGTLIGTFEIDAVPEPTGLSCCVIFGIVMTLSRRRSA